jgi:hypothetical protein
MTSDRQIAANRLNGRKSRGPRTTAGKSTDSRNALRHGLAAIGRRQPIETADLERLAKDQAESVIENLRRLVASMRPRQ